MAVGRDTECCCFLICFGIGYDGIDQLPTAIELLVKEFADFFGDRFCIAGAVYGVDDRT